ncbi:hypothetical protein QT998_24045 [Microcoleus sp. S1D4]
MAAAKSILLLILKVIGYWLLVIGYWLLVIGYWLLVIGCWLLVAGYWLPITNKIGKKTMLCGPIPNSQFPMTTN